jgi:hypothetical protein
MHYRLVEISKLLDSHFEHVKSLLVYIWQHKFNLEILMPEVLKACQAIA